MTEERIDGAAAPAQRTTLDTILRRLIWAAVLGALVLAGFGLYADVGQLVDNLRRFEWLYLPAALALVFLSYAIRLWRWNLYLRIAEVRVDAGESALIFFAGFVMAVTPGKFGEVLKSLLLRESTQTSIAHTAPVVIAERLTDLLALVVLASVGALSFRYGGVLIVVSGVLCVVGVVLISSRPLALTCIGLTRRMPVLHKVTDKLHQMYESMAELVRLGPLLWATGLAAVAWLTECAGVWLLCQGLGAQTVTLQMAVFIHAFATIFGAVSMMPGGLGVTEGSMTYLLVKLGKLTQAPAIAATLLVRLCTLWLGVVVGLAALLRWRKVHGRRTQLG